jgi:hypothetical protein
MGESLRVLPWKFGHVEKISARFKRVPDQQGHDSIRVRQTIAKWIGEEAGQGANSGKRRSSK